MRKRHILIALVIFAVTGAVNHSQNLAEAWQGDFVKNLSGMMTNAAHVNSDWQQESLIHKVGTDAYSGMSTSNMRPGGMSSEQGSVVGGQSRQPGEYRPGSPGNESQYGSNPSGNYLQRESSGSSSSKGPYGGSVYGGPPTTPSADPMIKELSRDPSMR
jgi:hypothetical protein